MTHIRQIADALGRAEIAAAVGVQRKTVSNYVRRGLFPSSWWLGMKALADRASYDLPDRAFDWSLPSAALDQRPAARACDAANEAAE